MECFCVSLMLGHNLERKWGKQQFSIPVSMCQEELEIWTVTAVKSGASVKEEGGAGTAMLKESGASTAMLKASHKGSSGLLGACLRSCACFLGGWGSVCLCWGLVCSGLAA